MREGMRPAAAVAREHRLAGWWGDATLGERVRELASTRPDGAAFVGPAGTLDWAGYDGASDHLARLIRALGFGVGERIGIVVPDGPGVHVAFVAAERAGVVTVGIGSRAGALEVEHVLRRAGAVGLVTGPTHRGRPAAELVADLRAAGLPLRHHVVIPPASWTVAAIEVDGGAAPEVTGVALAHRADPDELFLINSTSGTTGLPKCVLHNQNRWLYFARKAQEFGELGADEVFMPLIPAPYGFGLWTAHFAPVVLGAPSVLLERFDAATALACVAEHGVTVLCCVSTQFLLMMREAAFDRTDFSSLRVMFTGGEMVPAEQALAWERSTGSLVLQFFGSNETGMLSATRVSDPPDVRLGTMGRPVPEMNVRIFDDSGRDSATGEGQPGCRGPATSLGYDDVAANSELYTADGWMLMADLCAVGADGALRMIGRKSDLIIRGGKNISAAEVEQHVTRHPQIALAAAVAVPDEVFGERVCAVVQLVDGASPPTLEQLVDFLRSSGISPELLPEHLVVLPVLPISSGGKVAKGELRRLIAERHVSNQHFNH